MSSPYLRSSWLPAPLSPINKPLMITPQRLRCSIAVLADLTLTSAIVGEGSSGVWYLDVMT